jgi:2-polyprenyl-3-methyl-5-hydroxy-6-metoxy-1,4-benzoquinol methylase
MFRPYEIEWTDEKVSRLWDFYSKNKYSDNLYFSKLVGGHVIDYLNRRIGLRNKSILDYGSGPGHLFEFFSKKNLNIKYNAIDFSEESIAKLKTKFSNSPQFQNAYFVNKFPSNINDQFDVIISCEVVEHLTDERLATMMEEVQRLIKNDGIIYITTPNNEDLNANKFICPDSGCVFHRWQHVRSWNASSLSKFMESKGFQTLHVATLNFHQQRPLHYVKEILKKIVKPNEEHGNLVYIGRLKLI